MSFKSLHIQISVYYTNLLIFSDALMFVPQAPILYIIVV